MNEGRALVHTSLEKSQLFLVSTDDLRVASSAQNCPEIDVSLICPLVLFVDGFEHALYKTPLWTPQNKVICAVEAHGLVELISFDLSQSSDESLSKKNDSDCVYTFSRLNEAQRKELERRGALDDIIDSAVRNLWRSNEPRAEQNLVQKV